MRTFSVLLPLAAAGCRCVSTLSLCWKGRSDAENRTNR